jgi:hypothetical protein
MMRLRKRVSADYATRSNESYGEAAEDRTATEVTRKC